jgi:hypothetical protein
MDVHRGLSLLACAGAAGLCSLAASSATLGDAPRVGGPLRLHSSDCHTASNGRTCVYVYQLDSAATTDPRAVWRVYWARLPSQRPAERGTCTTEVAEAMQWGTGGRPGPAPARTYPAIGTTPVSPGTTARLVADAAGHARRAGRLEQRTAWPRGIVRGTAGAGQFIALWEGRTTRSVLFTLGAEVRNPGTEFGGGAETHDGVSAPCSVVPAPGPGFSARLSRSSVKEGGTAWLQLRIPGLKPRLDFRSGLITFAGLGSATYTVTEDGTKVAESSGPIRVAGRTAVSLGFDPGRYVVHVALRGTTGTRRYSLPLTVGS